MLALVTGGSGSGKSACAERLGARLAAEMPGARLLYIATMERGGVEAERRIARHVAQRSGLGFETAERPRALGTLDVPPGCVALLEDLPNLMANELFGGDPDRALPDVLALAARCRHLVAVAGDVFSDGGDYGESTREYMRRLAALQNGVARAADYAAEVVCSVPVTLKGEAPCGL